MLKATKFRLDDAFIQNSLGALLRPEGKFAESETAHREAIRLKPDVANFHQCLGGVLAKQERFAEAVLTFRQAIMLAPTNSSLYAELGYVLRRLGRFDDSLAAYLRSHELGRGQPDPLFRRARGLHDAEQLAAAARRVPPFFPARPCLPISKIRLLWRSCSTIRNSTQPQPEPTPPHLPPIRDWRNNSQASIAIAPPALRPWLAAAKARIAPGRTTMPALGYGKWLWIGLTPVWRRTSDGPRRQLTKGLSEDVMKLWQEDSDLAGVHDAAALAKLPDAERVALAEALGGRGRTAKTLRGVADYGRAAAEAVTANRKLIPTQ